MSRKLDYLSPSGIGKYVEDPEMFYIRYVSDRRPPSDPQTQPMSVGSAFDAYAKSFFHEKLFGKGNDPKFEFTTLFEAQVENHNRTWAMEAGKYAFECYKKSGALSDLMLELQKAVNVPKFEFEVKGVINGYREGATLSTAGVVLLGKPDVFFINSQGAQVILDFKVNGFCSKWHKSPMKGFIRVRDGVKNISHHREAVLKMHNGMIINIAHRLEELDESWARQLSIYAWLSGAEVGGDYITAIDQLVCSPSDDADKPTIKVAEHRCRVSSEYQFKTFALAQEIWENAHSDHFFKNMSKEDSQARCAILDNYASNWDATKPEDIAFLEVTKTPNRWR